MFIVFLVWGGLDGWEWAQGWMQGASFLDDWPFVVWPLFALSLAGSAIFELLSARKLTIGPDKIVYKYKTPFNTGGWEAPYHEYTALEFKRSPVKVLGFSRGDILVVELVHSIPLQTVPLIMCSPVHETRVRDSLEGLCEYFGLPSFDRTLIGDGSTTGIQDWRAASWVPWLLFFGTLLFIPAVYGLEISYSVESRLLTTEDWPQTTCTIVQSKMRPFIESESKYDTHTIDIFYQYEVDGKEYESNNYSMAGNTTTEVKAQHIITQYPAGSQTICYTNPENPTKAVLDHGNQNIFTWLRLPFWIMLVVSLFLLRRGILNWKKSRKI